MTSEGLVAAQLTRSVIGAFFEVYTTLGYGFLEEVYARSLAKELNNRGHSVAREVRIPIRYKGEIIAFQRLDMVVDAKLIVEVKSTSELHQTAARQVYHYLRATSFQVGLLLHFGPEAKFHRLISLSSSHPCTPRDPHNPV